MQYSEIRERRCLVYEQDCQFYRHQDRLAWTRANIALAIEAFFLSIVLSKNVVKSLGDMDPSRNFWIKLGFIVCLFLLVTFFLSLYRRDDKLARIHLKRIKEFEDTVETKVSFPKKESKLAKYYILIILYSHIVLLAVIVFKLIG